MSSKKREANPITQRIIRTLTANPTGMPIGVLCRVFKMPRKSLQVILHRLEKRDVVDRVGNRYYISRPESRFKGRFRRKLSGSGTVFSENSETEIIISRKTGFHLVDGDIVKGIAHPGPHGRLKGVITEIHTRRQDPVTGYFRKSASGGIVLPLDPRICRPVDIVDSSTKGLKNKVVIVELLHTRSPDTPPRGKITDVLGERFDFGVQTSIISLKFGIRDTMPASMDIEADHLIAEAARKDMTHRTDLRNVLTITVDPVNARDFDDALSLECLPEGYRLGVHIADVSHYVPAGSPVDQEAYRRGTSVYLPERAIHMLPERLATDVCSLRPGEDRPAVSVMIDFDRDGVIRNGTMFESLIRSDARLTYEDFLSSSTDKTSGSPVTELCKNLSELCRKLLDQRVSRGALDLEMPEADFELDTHGKVIGIHKKRRSIAEQTIEEFMIAANVVVAEHLDASKTPYIRRFHEPPDPSEISDLKAALAQLGLDPPSNPLDPDQVRNLLRQIEHPAIRSVASHRILRAMKRAIYSATLSGHFGLALDYYTQFTSPIRRYPDLEVHRSLKTALKLPGYETPGKSELIDRARHLSECERRAQEAEWEAHKIEKIRFMQNRIGEEYTGTITQVMQYGAYIELEEPFVDGFVPVATLDEFFHFHDAKNQLANTDGSIILKPGGQVIIRVEIADLDRGMLDFSLVRCI